MNVKRVLVVIIRKRKTGKEIRLSFSVEDAEMAIAIIGMCASKRAPIVSAYMIETWETGL